MKLCLKIFWSATYMEVPALLLQPEPFAGWMTALHTLVVRPVPTVSGVPSEGFPMNQRFSHPVVSVHSKFWVLTHGRAVDIQALPH